MDALRPRINRFVPRTVIEAAQAFVSIEASSGIVLLVATVVALVWANSPWDNDYFDLWHRRVLIDANIFTIDFDLRDWLNEGLMTLFFFLIGLELKRELVHGEMADPRQALLPAVAAVGGMVAPAAIYAAFNAGGEGGHGWGIPMATDTAFALGVLVLIGRRAPFSVKVFLLAYALADDVGALLVIAVFYGEAIDVSNLLIAVGLLGVIFGLNRGGVRSVPVYIVLGVALWVAAVEAHTHGTLAGIALGLLTPASPFYAPAGFAESAQGLIGRFQAALGRANQDEQQGVLSQMEDLSRGTEAPLDRLERGLHPWVSFAVVPLFALANAGVPLSGDSINAALESPVSQGVFFALVAGKPLGIFGATWLALKLGLCALPSGTRMMHVAGVALLGGIGFTVSLLVTELAFAETALVDDAKLGIMAASLAAGVIGFAFLWLTSAEGNGTETA